MCGCSLPVRTIIIFSVIGFLFIITFFPLYFGGYIDGNKQNQYEKQTACKILANNITNTTCSFDCDCSTVCYGGGPGAGCETSCDICYSPCYNGYITVLYLRNFSAEFQVYSGYFNYTDIIIDLKTNYQIGSQIICFYNNNNLTQVELAEYDAEPYKIAAFISAGVCAGILIIWALIEAIIMVLKKYGIIG